MAHSVGWTCLHGVWNGRCPTRPHRPGAPLACGGWPGGHVGLGGMRSARGHMAARRLPWGFEDGRVEKGRSVAAAVGGREEGRAGRGARPPRDGRDENLQKQGGRLGGDGRTWSSCVGLSQPKRRPGCRRTSRVGVSSPDFPNIKSAGQSQVSERQCRPAHTSAVQLSRRGGCSARMLTAEAQCAMEIVASGWVRFPGIRQPGRNRQVSKRQRRCTAASEAPREGRTSVPRLIAVHGKSVYHGIGHGKWALVM